MARNEMSVKIVTGKGLRKNENQRIKEINGKELGWAVGCCGWGALWKAEVKMAP